jgi:NAD(P)-dependent dehydrogenase (short-subunit alcohol dehydrogenase family)
MKRTYVVTGGASGIGFATKKKLEALGHKAKRRSLQRRVGMA